MQQSPSPIRTLSSQPVENQTFRQLAGTPSVIGGRTAWMAKPGHDGDCGLRKTAPAPWAMATGATFRARISWRQSDHRAAFWLRTNVAQFSTFAKGFHRAHGGRPSAGTPRTGASGDAKDGRRRDAAAPQMQCGRRRKAVTIQSFWPESREFECEEQGNFAEEQGDFAREQ